MNLIRHSTSSIVVNMRTSNLIILFIFLTLNCIFGQESRSSKNPPLSFTDLAKKYGYNAEEYNITTDDGYILGLFRIPGKRGFPILLMHGIADTSDSWLLRGETSLGITLANREYDVWFGNIRGNKYSRRHVTFNPDKDSSFWDFSFHENGYYDLKAIIDTILSKSGATKINAVAHSQGNTIFYVLGSTRPEYNKKVNVLTALAPVCFLNHIPPPTSILIKFAPEINTIAKVLGIKEIFGDVSVSGKITDVLCNTIIVGYPVCAIGALFPLSGFDVTELGPKFYSIAIKHFPSSTTIMNLYHFAQVARRRSFARFDYGPEKNVQLYNSITPPNYDLKKVTMPVVLIVAQNDKISTIPDVVTLKEELPNVEKYIIIKRKLTNHLDFVWGEEMEEYLFPYIFDALEGGD